MQHVTPNPSSMPSVMAHLHIQACFIMRPQLPTRISPLLVPRDIPRSTLASRISAATVAFA
jgi:hypothetical protein